MSRLARDGTERPNPSCETKFSGANGDREVLFFLVQLTTSSIGNLTRFIHILLYVLTIYTVYCKHTLMMAVVIPFDIPLDIRWLYTPENIIRRKTPQKYEAFEHPHPQVLTILISDETSDSIRYF